MKLMILTIFGTATVLATILAGSADEPSAERLENQQHNRMVYIRTDDKPAIFVDMPKHYDVGSPSFSPSGKRIVFDANTIGETPVRQTWMVAIDGHGLHKLADNAAAPRWSRDEGKIVYTRDREGHANIHSKSDIYEYDVSTGQEKKLFEGRFGDWSPDGKKLAFSRGGEITENGGTHWSSFLYTANLDGSNEEELGRGDWPSWSPDGKKVAYVRHDEGEPPVVWIRDLAMQTRYRLGIGFYRPQWTGDSDSVCVLTYALREDARGVVHRPVRLYLAMDRQTFFLMNLDNPWAPCISADGKTTIAVVDSKKQTKPQGDRED